MHGVQTASSDLESLMYSFLYVATLGKLPWGAMTHDTNTALYTKLSCMTQPSMFEEDVGVYITDARLKAIANNLRGLFFVDERYVGRVSASKFIEMLA